MTLTDAEVAALEKFLRTQWIGDDTMRGVVAKLQAHVPAGDVSGEPV